ncbi:DUF3604 domain-containing protein [Seongchinamella sediminis]|uniref:DUF3604 domain-containing protein n=1 Tax=Seongchinamella sediminis TaxID=2283635 RepID=A0A3L7DXR8_9GAMM|nr:DUF3604 domain-containing protein [Seongchinamella sediminis]RLQ22387.1 DUF3604 domain-containing protein [Seongchinamella sediminis]
MRTGSISLFLMAAATMLVACDASEGPSAGGDAAAVPASPAATAVSETAAASPAVTVHPDREAFFGNFHIHTRYSFDGYANGSVTGPDDAYRWARGEAIPGGGDGSMLKILRPLDWYAVSDHGEFLGVFPSMEDPDSPLSKLAIAARLTSDDQKVAFDAYSETLANMSAGDVDPALLDREVVSTIWQDVVATADKHNDPGSFTTFPAYEWTSNPEKQNLHRVVVFRGSAGVPEVPFSSIDSDRPEDLWQWMDGLRASGVDLLAIPHNGNASNGLMFPEETSYGGSAVDADYAARRMRNEPVYEVSQIKGSSETHPLLSPNDEFAGFEIWDYTLSTDAVPPEKRQGGYARGAYLAGLELAGTGRGNPFKFGLIGDSDSHNSAAMIEENNYRGKFGMENNPRHRLLGLPGFPERNNRAVREFSSGGVAGIWAESNTRDSLFEAIMRKETFATSGPRMKVRFFGGYAFDAASLTAGDWVTRAYRQGVSMGGDLGPDEGGAAPTFLIMAAMEADGAHLDRIQVVKGWVEDGEHQEKIFDVAWAGDRKIDAAGALPPIGSTVNIAGASYDNSIGKPQLQAVWTDPEFDASRHAVYYVRVLQIPTPRWSTYDASTLGIAPRDDLPVTIQERAWSSPIWYTP